jgi:hypothetical protein
VRTTTRPTRGTEHRYAPAVQTLELPITPDPLPGGTPDRARRSARRSRPRPIHRPPAPLRALIGLIGMAAVVSIVAIMLSDRAPRLLREVFGDAAVRLSARIDASERLPSTAQLPESDFLAHVGMWAVAAVLVGWTVWSWRGLVLGTLTVLVLSMLVEAAQGTYSDTRAVEASDVTANALGVGLGATVATACYLLWSSIASLVDRFRARP